MGDDASDIPRHVTEAVARHPAVTQVRLVGSRSRGNPTTFSDWDFEVVTDDFPSLASVLSSLTRPLLPYAEQWDRLSEDKCYMLVLKGPTKVDLLFDVPNEQEPPWEVRRETLATIDDHFWDWVLWLLSKQAARKDQLVVSELEKMFHHLLEPMGASTCPPDIFHAIEVYTAARNAQERRHDIHIPRTLERVARPSVYRLRRIMGFP